MFCLYLILLPFPLAICEKLVSFIDYNMMIDRFTSMLYCEFCDVSKEVAELFGSIIKWDHVWNVRHGVVFRHVASFICLKRIIELCYYVFLSQLWHKGVNA
ncbi:hypothetical protein ES288_D04G132700v1 [Gossypium darwinii]|uniref:Secreted protein n=1 Tax=Gossypium darwinii TaxID=34276 RepID=A0A5D2CVY6_GOSDA|nr:hypothetical protein ES288_D04G132700v1 [Gossypium darwinii]